MTILVMMSGEDKNDIVVNDGNGIIKNVNGSRRQTTLAQDIKFVENYNSDKSDR